MRLTPQISIRYDGELAIFDITGYLTEDSEQEMNDAYEQANERGTTKILLNFDRQSRITSSGFGLIVKLIWKMRNTGQTLRVTHPSDQMRKNFDIIGLARSIKIFASEAEALADF